MKPGSSDFCKELTASFGRVCEISIAQCERLAAHFELLIQWNRKLNLTSVRDPLQMIERHYCESLFLGSHLPMGALTVIDVGSGAGFPGVGVAVLRPEAVVTLCESNRRKAVFLRESTRGLPNVQVADCRAEDLGARFDWVVSRAVAWEALPLIGSQVALLGSEPGPDFPWRERIRLPWGDRRVLYIGDVPRGTSADVS